MTTGTPSVMFKKQKCVQEHIQKDEAVNFTHV